MAYKFEEIDKVLKENLDSFQPNPPSDCWNAIESKIPTSTIGTQTLLVKSSIWLKTIAVVTLSAIAGSLIWYHSTTPAEKPTSVSYQAANDIKPDEQVRDIMPSTTNLSENKAKPTKEISVQNENSSISGEEKQSQEKLDNKTPMVLPLEKNTQSAVNQEVKQEISAKKVNVSKELTPSKKIIEKRNEPIETKSTQMSVEESSIFIPNIFTPNAQDDLNSNFEIKIENETRYQLRIYNEKGNLVFQSDDSKILWNGMLFNSGDLCEEGIYTYAFTYQLNGQENVKTINGRVQLKR